VKSAIEVDVNIDNGHNNCQTAVKEDGGFYLINCFRVFVIGLKKMSIKKADASNVGFR
jgi:hypothetical protein